MRSESEANDFFETTKKKVEKYKFIEKPSLPRKRKAPNYNILERYYNVVGLSSIESGACHPSFPSAP